MNQFSANFTRYVTEFIVIFLGVSLSFFAENFREDRAERASERDSLERLVADLQAGDFDREVNTYTASTLAIRSILDARDGEIMQVGDMNELLASAVRCVPSWVNTSEYQSLKSSGSINRFQDADFRQQLTNHYERYPGVYQFVESDCDWSFLNLITAELKPNWSDFGPGIPEFSIIGNVQNIISNKEFMMQLAEVHFRKHILLQRFEVLSNERAILIDNAMNILENEF